ncbi:MAG: hypothetical protein LC664_11615 [Flavobacteriales bacterium]|nr:hypothetical protein [Flavobacteriales bacterium]
MALTLKKSIFLFVLGIGLVLLAEPAAHFLQTDVDRIQSSKEFAQKLDEKTNTALRAILDVQKKLQSEGIARAHWQNTSLFNSLREQDIHLSVFRNDELALWTSQTVSPISVLRTAVRGTEIAHFDNGWYRLLYLTDGVDEYCAAILIKNTFPYENAYLNNSFQDDLEQDYLLDIDTKPSTNAVKLKADHQSFYLKFEEAGKQGTAKGFIFILFSLIGGGAVLMGLLLAALSLRNQVNHAFLFILLAAATAILRYFSLSAGWPSYVIGFDLFSPSVYASSLIFPSIADFVINIALVLILAFMALGPFGKKSPEKHGDTVIAVIIFLLTALSFAFGAWVNYMVKGVIINSSIPFDINNILGLNIYSLLALVGVAGLYYSYYLFALRTALYAHRRNYSPVRFFLINGVVILLFVLTTHYFGIRDLYFVLWSPLLLIVVSVYVFYTNLKTDQLSRMITLLVFFGVIASHSFLKFTEKRERNQRQILAEKLAVDDDPVAEILYRDLLPDLKRDKGIQNVFEESDLHSRQTLEDYVLSRYFSGYWSKYDISLFPYQSDSSIWGKLPNVRPTTFSELYSDIEKYGEKSAVDSSLYYMYNTADLATYMAVIPLQYTIASKPDGYLILKFSSKFFPRETGFPSLLIDGNVGVNRDWFNTSSGRYVNGKLTTSRGKYPFKSELGTFGNIPENNSHITKGGYEHFVKRVDNNSVVIVSKQTRSLLEKATTFSYLCAIFGILLALGYAIRVFIVSRNPFYLNLNQKIQGLTVAVSLITLLLFGFATRYYIEKKYTEKNENQVGEKLQSILLELQGKIGEEEQLNYDISDMLNRLLTRFSYIFYTDINVYNPEGYLVASSQMRMFNEALVSRMMNPDAFLHLKRLKQVEYVHEEKIGNMKYLSGYIPLYNTRGDLLAYINLPYFAKQTELENELSSFLEAVINIFVVLFLLSLLIGLFTAQWITQPLRNIRQSLAGVDLGKTNRMISYSGSDEIGRLVKEYNTKVAELELNTEKLAQSERESAWREMAKQVAHEIKNPLTPMKLNIQHLERSLDPDKPVDTDRIKRLTSNLIDQINALTSIANAFSDFARMPRTQLEKVDLIDIINHIISLYDGFGEIDFEFKTELKTAQVKTDKDQIIRVMNNLVKNGVQAMNEKGKIAGSLGLHK